MNINPYQAPEIPAESEEVRQAQCWIAAPALGIWITGALYFGFGIVSTGAILVGMGSIAYRMVRWQSWPPQEVLINGIGFLIMSVVIAAVGWFAMRFSKQLCRLDSKQGAYIACIFGLIMYPMCVVTLPLGIYGLIVLRRADVKEVLRARTTARRKIDA